MNPLPFTWTLRVSQENPSRSHTKSYVDWEICIRPGTPVDSILLAVFTVSPNKQKRGILLPTTPEHTSPV